MLRSLLLLLCSFDISESSESSETLLARGSGKRNPSGFSGPRSAIVLKIRGISLSRVSYRARTTDPISPIRQHPIGVHYAPASGVPKIETDGRKSCGIGGYQPSRAGFRSTYIRGSARLLTRTCDNLCPRLEEPWSPRDSGPSPPRACRERV